MKRLISILFAALPLLAMAQGKTHGGILADAGERTFQELSACLENDCPFVVMLEGVEDPFNLGYVIRSLYSAGCTGLWRKAPGTGQL